MTRFWDSFAAARPQDQAYVDFKELCGLDRLLDACKDDFEKMVLLNEWTYHQFSKFGRPSCSTENAREIILAVRAGHRFYCAHFAIVMAAAAVSLGWKARLVSLRTADYPQRISNHTMVEIWSTAHGKWLAFDPTLNYHIVNDAGIPLHSYESGREWFGNQGRNLRYILGTARRELRVQDLPYTLSQHPGFGVMILSPAGTVAKQALLAFTPSNRLLGEHGSKSIERWDDWENMVIVRTDITEGGDMALVADIYSPMA
jgi:hypothetical protein